jgi:hypothetical protein
MSTEDLNEINPWPPADSSADERSLAQGWQALDALLTSAAQPLSPFELSALAQQVVRQAGEQAAWQRRRRTRLLAVAALLLAASGAPQQVARVVAPAAIDQVPIDAQAPAAEDNDWDDNDEWVASVSVTQQQADDLETGWRVPWETWSSVRQQMDALEDEWSDVSL